MNDDEEPTVACPTCGFTGGIDDFDCLGACGNNLFCNCCNTEIDEDGKVALLCGECDWCRGMMIDGEFATVQDERRAKRELGIA